MKTFRSLEEVESAGLSPPVHVAVHGVLNNVIHLRQGFGGRVGAYAQHGEVYDPEDDGYTILVEGAGSRTRGCAAEIGFSLREALLEGGFHETGCFQACTLHNNPYGIRYPNAYQITFVRRFSCLCAAPAGLPIGRKTS